MPAGAAQSRYDSSRIAMDASAAAIPCCEPRRRGDARRAVV